LSANKHQINNGFHQNFLEGKIERAVTSVHVMYLSDVFHNLTLHVTLALSQQIMNVPRSSSVLGA